MKKDQPDGATGPVHDAAAAPAGVLLGDGHGRDETAARAWLAPGAAAPWPPPRS
jgi:hypothetical protein